MDCVAGVPKEQWDELRGMSQPPFEVRLCVQAVAMMLQVGVVASWVGSRDAVANGPDCVRLLRALDHRGGISVERRARLVSTEFLGHAAFDIQNIDLHSKAAGPLAAWLVVVASLGDKDKEVKALRARIATFITV